MASLTEILILRGVMPIESLDSMSPADEESTVRDLLERGVLTEVQLASARAALAGLPFVELLDFAVDARAVALVPAQVCRRYGVLPIGFSGDYLILAMVDPGDVFAIDDVRQVARQPVKCVVAERSDLFAAIDRFHRADGELSSLSTELEEQAGPGELVRAESNEPKEDDAPIVRFVNLLISQGIQDLASDIHIEPGEYDLGVRYRIDGVMHEMQRAPKNIQNGVISRLKIMADIDIAERRKPQDGRMSVSHGGRKIDLRVATLPTVWGEKVVMRILDNNASNRDMADLALLPHNFEAYRRSYSKPYGMILVTGPTGSGKSTTLYTTLHAVARPEINVITVEDPVEYRLILRHLKDHFSYSDAVGYTRCWRTDRALRRSVLPSFLFLTADQGYWLCWYGFELPTPQQQFSESKNPAKHENAKRWTHTYAYSRQQHSVK